MVAESVVTASKEAILEAAQRLILRSGYSGLSMRELAKQSGLAKGTIYHHFRNKQELYLEALERDLLTVRDRLAAAAGQSGDCKQRLQAVIETYFALIQERRHMILVALREIEGLEAQLRALVQKHRDEFLRPIAAIIEQGIREGIFRPVNAKMTVISLFGMMNSFVTHHLLLDQVDIDQDVVTHTLELFLHGIMAGAETQTNARREED